MNLGGSVKAISEQITVLGLAMGCTLKSIALNDPERAAAIEENMRFLIDPQKAETWHPASAALLDLMFTALNEKPKT